VKTIGEIAFGSCKNLEVLIMGDALKTIGNEAFSENTKLKTVTIGKNLETIGEEAFVGNKIKTLNTNNVVTIKDGAFFDCENLEVLIMGDALKTIGNEAFSANTKLKTVTIGKNLETIGEDVFEGTCFEEDARLTQENLKKYQGKTVSCPFFPWYGDGFPPNSICPEEAVTSARFLRHLDDARGQWDEDCREWCSVYTCDHVGCKQCCRTKRYRMDDGTPHPCSYWRDGEYCASWCNFWTSSSSFCQGCSASECHSWCNSWTCGMDACKECSQCVH
jgi:hypothetical protein